MRIKTRPDDVSMLQMNDWLAELRDEDRAEATREEAAGDPVAAAPNGSAAPAETAVPGWASAPAETGAPAGTPAETRAPAQVPAETRAPAQVPAETRAPTRVGAAADVSPAASAPERAVIGDEIRMPIMWCEMGSCISWYTHRAALGEADTRARAIAAGWRIDALGRLTCPQCQQTDPRFWASCAVVPWDRYTAIARAARITTVRSDGARGTVPEISHDRGRMAGRDPRRAASGHLGASGHLAASPVESAWQRSYAAARTM